VSRVRRFRRFLPVYLTLTGVVENDSECVPVSGAKTIDAVTKVHPVPTLLALHWPMTNSKHDRVTFQQRHNDRLRLHTRPLFRHHKLAACEVAVRRRQQNRHLKREQARRKCPGAGSCNRPRRT